MRDLISVQHLDLDPSLPSLFAGTFDFRHRLAHKMTFSSAAGSADAGPGRSGS